jgi:hypothetical protein
MIQSSVVGEATIDLIEMTKQPKNTWFLNKIMKIQGPEKLAKQLNGDLGEIYVQCKYL